MIALTAALALPGCGRRGSTPAPDQATTSVSGRVRIAGSTPLEQVLIEPGDTAAPSLEVSGDYRQELRRLSGAKVRASGTLAGPGQLRVSEYEILEIAGHVPLVGILAAEDGRAAVLPAGGARVEVRAAPPELLEQAGAKVWVILDANGEVKGYGIIRER